MDLSSPGSALPFVTGVPAMLPLRRWERALLVLGAAVAGALGLVLLLLPGNRFVGAGECGSALGLVLGLRAGEWRTARLPVMAALASNTAAVVACGTLLASGAATPRVYGVLGGSLAAGASAGLLLALRYGTPRSMPDLARWAVALLVVQTALAAVVGLPLLLAPVWCAQHLGVPGADAFLYRLGGAMLVGYGSMALGGVRCRNRAELRVPTAMVLVLCGLCALVSSISLVIGERSALGYGVAVLAPLMAVASVAHLSARH